MRAVMDEDGEGEVASLDSATLRHSTVNAFEPARCDAAKVGTPLKAELLLDRHVMR